MGYQTHIGELELGRWHNVGLIAAYCFEHDLHLTSGALNQQHTVRWTFCSATELYNILAGNVTQLVLPRTILTCNSIIASSLEISHYKFDSPLRFVLTTGVQARHSEDRRQVDNMQKSLAEAEAEKVRLARLTEDRDLPQASKCNPSAGLYRAVGEDNNMFCCCFVLQMVLGRSAHSDIVGRCQKPLWRRILWDGGRNAAHSKEGNKRVRSVQS